MLVPVRVASTPNRFNNQVARLAVGAQRISRVELQRRDHRHRQRQQAEYRRPAIARAADADPAAAQRRHRGQRAQQGRREGREHRVRQRAGRGGEQQRIARIPSESVARPAQHHRGEQRGQCPGLVRAIVEAVDVPPPHRPETGGVRQHQQSGRQAVAGHDFSSHAAGPCGAAPRPPSRRRCPAVRSTRVRARWARIRRPRDRSRPAASATAV